MTPRTTATAFACSGVTLGLAVLCAALTPRVPTGVLFVGFAGTLALVVTSLLIGTGW